MSNMQPAVLTDEQINWTASFLDVDPKTLRAGRTATVDLPQGVLHDRGRGPGGAASAAAQQPAAVASDAGGEASGSVPLIDPPLPQDSSDSRDALLQAVRTFVEGIQPSSTASGFYDVAVNGKMTRIDYKQYEGAKKQLSEELLGILKRVRIKTDAAMSLYDGQNKANEEYWLTSHVVQFFGRVKDPGPFLKKEVDAANAAYAAAKTALAKGDFLAGASSLADCESAATKAHTLAQGYFEGTIDASEFQIKVLEGVEEGSKVTLTILAVVATAGGAAVATTAGAVGAIGKTAIETSHKAAAGETINIADVTVDVAVELLLAKFGGGLEHAVKEAVVEAVLRRTAGKFAKEAITKVLVEAYKVALKKVAAAAINRMAKTKDVPKDELVDSIAEDLRKPDSIQAELVKLVIETLMHAH